MSEQFFVEPAPYFVLNAEEVQRLQAEAAERREVVENPKASSVDRTRAAARLKDVERQIHTSRMAQRQAAPPPACRAPLVRRDRSAATANSPKHKKTSAASKPSDPVDLPSRSKPRAVSGSSLLNAVSGPDCKLPWPVSPPRPNNVDKC